MSTRLNIHLLFNHLGSPKTYGNWTNLGECVKHEECKWCVSTGGSNVTCGPGVQQQTRTCQDGRGGGDVDDTDESVKNEHICETADTIRIIDCLIAKCPDEANKEGLSGNSTSQDTGNLS